MHSWRILRDSLPVFGIAAVVAAGKNLIIDTDIFSDCE